MLIGAFLNCQAIQHHLAGGFSPYRVLYHELSSLIAELHLSWHFELVFLLRAPTMVLKLCWKDDLRDILTVSVDIKNRNEVI